MIHSKKLRLELAKLKSDSVSSTIDLSGNDVNDSDDQRVKDTFLRAESGNDVNDADDLRVKDTFLRAEGPWFTADNTIEIDPKEKDLIKLGYLIERVKRKYHL